MQHKKMRKKKRRMQRDFKDLLHFSINQRDWQWCLKQYASLEEKSWKKGKVGISKNLETLNFYTRLFKRLHAAGDLYFGILTVDDVPVSAEIAYTCNKTVYFCHGCYDQAFKKYSPGMVSTSFFLEYFFNTNYTRGDFLCGFAGYLNDWSDTIIATNRIDIFNKRPGIQMMFALQHLKHTYYSPMKKRLLAINEKHRPNKLS
jgi:CelD/BcsL family acetyltransferase involved in cellulose biosynthesis